MFLRERSCRQGKRYQVQVFKNGIRVSKTFKIKKEAEAWAREMEVSVDHGEFEDRRSSSKVTFAELAEKYEQVVLPTKPRSKQEGIVRRLKKDLGGYTLDKITPRLLSEYKDHLLGEITPRGKKRSGSTVVRILVTLSHIFSKAAKEWGLVRTNPVLRIEKPKESEPRIRFLDDEERVRLLEACKKSSCSLLYSLVIVAISCGARQGEILGLHWSDVDFLKERLILRKTKNNEIRSVPLKGHALGLLKKLKTERNSEFVFPNKKLDGPIDIRSSWEFAIQRAGIKNFRFHDLRHSCASGLAMCGASLLEIAEVLGHKTLTMVKRYSHLTESHTSKVVEKMNEGIFGGDNV